MESELESTPPVVCKGAPSVSICLVCVTYKGEERVERMLWSVPSCAVQYILIYQDYCNPSYKGLAGYPAHYFDGNKNLGVVAAYNQAIYAAVDRGLVETDKWILLVDDDVIFPPGFFITLNELIDTLEDCVLSWKSTVNPPEIPGCVELATELAGYAFAFPYTFFQRLNGFDEKNFHHYCGDSDFARRVMRDLKRPCYRVHYPLVTHEEHAAVKENPELDGPSWAVKDRENYKRKWAGVKERDLIRSLLKGTDLED